MTEFNPEEFRDSIDDMCDDAVRRLYAMQEGGLVVMQPGDAYLCEDFMHNDALNVTEFTTRIRSILADGIHREVIESDMPDYTLEILGGAVVALAKHAAYRGRGSTVIVPRYEAARSHVYERLMMQRNAVEDKSSVSLYVQDLGSLGLVSLRLAYEQYDWSVSYESRRRTALKR